MYKYKVFRYIFRAFNLVIYAIVASVIFIAITNEVYISDFMDSIFHGYFMDSKHSLLLAFLLLANMLMSLIKISEPTRPY